MPYPSYNGVVRDHLPQFPVAAVLFDYGQVLSGPPHPPAWTRMLDITGLSESTFNAAYWAPRHDYDRGTHTGPQYWLAAGRHAGLELSPTEVDALIAADNALWTQLNQPMVDWAQRLHAAGTPTGILSNLGDSMTEGVLAAHPWLSAFDYLLWSHTRKLAKPEVAIYLQAAQGLHAPPAQILFIDDREENIAGAFAAGMQVVHYTTQPAFEEELERRGLADLWQTGRLPAV